MTTALEAWLEFRSSPAWSEGSNDDESDFVAGAAWQASQPFTEKQIDAAAWAIRRDDPEADTYGFEDYRAMARAALDAAFPSKVASK